MTGYVRKDTTNNIADGNVINAADLDAEFDGVQDAFNASTGHNHDGTTGEGAPITALGPTQDVTISAILLAPKTNNTVDIGSSSLRYKDLFLAGNGSIGGTLAVTGVATLTAQPILSSLTASRAVFTDGSKGLVSNAITGTGNVVMSASPTLTGTIDAAAATLSGNLTLSGGTANGVAYLNGSKVVTSGSALTFDGQTLTNTCSTPILLLNDTATSNLALRLLSTGGVSYIQSGISGGAFAPLAFTSNGGVSEQMRLTSTGLGIGTSSPVANTPLTLQASSGYTDILWLKSVGTNIDSRINIAPTGTGVAQLNNTNGTPIAFQISGSEVGRFTSTGLGIGTSSPAYKLDVNGQARLGGSTGLVFGVGTAFAGGQAEIYSTSTTPMGLGTTGAAVLRLYTNSTLQATLDSSGNLGLGVTPSAWTTFKVMQLGNFGAIGGVDSTSMNMFANTFYDGAFKYINTSSASRYRMDDGHSWFTAPSGTAGNAITFTQAMTLDASGNLGVGTTSPTTRLSITDSTGPIVRLVRTSNRFELSADTDFMSLNARDASTYITFKTADTERARINSSGKFLVNTTSTVASGDEIAGFIGTAGISAKATGGSTRFAGSFWNDATTGDNVFLRFYSDGGTERGSITYNRAGGLTVYNTTSDYRAKDIYGPVTGSGALIDSVPVYMGKMKGATQERPMFIAHETPEYAHTGVKDAVDADGNPVYQQMDASALIPVMWAEIQSLRKRLADAGL